MKKLLLTSIIMISFCFFAPQAKAGTVSIDTSWQTQSAGPCDFSQGVRFLMQGTATGYTFFDSVKVKIAFGDGSFDSAYSYVDTSNSIYAFFSHNYSNSGAGFYTVQYIATSTLDFASDTLVVQNAVIYADSCGNVSGQVYLDQNSDCSFNGSDEELYGIRVNASQGGNLVASDWTDSIGNYSIEVPTGLTYTIEVVNPNGYSVLCPGGGSHTVSTFPNSGNDFALNCNPGFDLFGNVHGGSVPGQVINLYARTYNSYCTGQNGTMKIVFDDSLLSYGGTSNVTPAAINGDTVEWNFSNLNNSSYSSFGVNIGAITDTTAQIGDTVCITYIVEPMAGDSNVSNNVKQFCFPVRTSYDPNIKTVQPIGIGNSGKIAPNTDLTYTIHFQNTGTAQAYNIYILDTLDTSVLDPSTIQVHGASDPMVMNLISPNQNVIKFRFDDINLPDSNSNEPESHGWVTYSIKQQANLPHAETIRNSAAIYFDYNPAVITDSTLNTIDAQLVSLKPFGEDKEEFARIYPNPASQVINIELSENSNAQMRIFSLQGKLIREAAVVSKNTQLSVSDLESGIYLLEIRSSSGQRQLSKMIVSP